MANDLDIEREREGLEDEAAFDASLVADASAPAPGGATDSIPLPETQSPPPPAETLPQPQPPEPPPGSQPTNLKVPSWAGKSLGHFKLLRSIGQGAMGLVIQAIDVHLQRVVAIKVLRKCVQGLDSDLKVQQFLREAQAAARIEHPNVVRVYEINQHKGWWYIAMEMLEGETLHRVVKAAGPLPPSRACPVIADAAIALAAVHEMGILHRDVKPSNLFITRSGRCKLTDFGLVRLGDPNEPFALVSRSVGTPHFIAPEVVRGNEQTPAIDVYGLGASLYFALTGKPPYEGKNVPEICRQHVNSPVPELRDVCPDCPASLADLVRRTMAKQPQDRPSATDLAAALRAEAVDWRPDESGMSKIGSSIWGSSLSAAGSSRVHIPAAATAKRASPFAVPQWTMRLFKSRWRWPALAAALAIAVALPLWLLLRRPAKPGQSTPPPSGLVDRFPDAPATYGVLPSAATPEPLPLDTPPAFSWKGKVDTTGIKYIASRHGKHFYAIDDPAAALITLDNFVGYKTDADARADGKTPAP